MKKFFILIFLFVSVSFSQDFLKLDDCIRIAIENNLKLKIAKIKIEQAYYQKEIARKYFFPTLSSSFNYTYLGKNEGIFFDGFGPIKFTEDNLYTFKFTLTQPLFAGWKIERGYEITKDIYDKSKIDYYTELENLILDVKKAYFNVLKAKRFLETGNKYKESLERHLIDAKKCFEEGIVTKLDILRTELALKNVETKIIESENYLKIAKANLNFIMNKPVDYEFELELSLIHI